MNLQQLLLALKARYRIVVVLTVMTVVAAAVVSFILPKMYTATAAVVVDVKYADPIAGSILPALTQPSYMATQIDIIQSDRVAGKVVKELKLDQLPLVRDQWMESTGGKGDLVSWLAGGLKSKLEAKPGKDSNVIAITFKGRDSAMTAKVANAFAQAYIDTTVDLRVEPAKRYSTYFVEQTQAARDRLEKAQATLSDFQRTNQIVVVSDDKLDIETSRLNELSSQLSGIQGQRADSQSREDQAKSSSQSMQEVLQNPLVLNLKNDLAMKEAKLQQMSGNLGPNNPQLQQAQAEVQSLRARLAVEVGQVTAGVRTSNRVNTQREAEIKAALEAQKSRVLKLKQDRDAASVLQRDVDAAQRAYDAISQRTTQSNLESQTNQTNIAVLNPAIEPSRPSSPRVLINLLLALVVGLILGTGVALVVEQLDRRVRSLEDLGHVLGLPVLGLIEGPNHRRFPSLIPMRGRGALGWTGPSGAAS